MNDKRDRALKQIKEIVQHYEDKYPFYYILQGANYFYKVDPTGCKGPVNIEDWIVEKALNEGTYEAIIQKIKEEGLILNDIDPSNEDFEEWFTDLSTEYKGFGCETWDLEPWFFLEMMKDGCIPGTYYYYDDSGYVSEFDELLDYQFNELQQSWISWESLKDDELEDWLDLLQDSSNVIHW